LLAGTGIRVGAATYGSDGLLSDSQNEWKNRA
jgi:hypothetical protein